jgi:hypothetical protein
MARAGSIESFSSTREASRGDGDVGAGVCFGGERGGMGRKDDAGDDPWETAVHVTRTSDGGGDPFTTTGVAAEGARSTT